MAQKTGVKVVKYLEKCLEDSGLRISKIILFGSHARGKATAESDIDVAVVSEDFRGKNIFERVKLIKEAEVATIRRFVVPMDIVALTPEELESGASLLSDYIKTGKTLYAA